MNTRKILHILRNPYTWSVKDKTNTRIAAADLIEAQADELRIRKDHLFKCPIDTMSKCGGDSICIGCETFEKYKKKLESK